MAGSKARESNPFLDDSDDVEVDDFLFLHHPRQGSSGYMLQNQQNESVVSQQHRITGGQTMHQLLEQRKEVEDRMLASSNSAVGLLYDTERVGIATAEELVHQGEQLRNVERKVDDINSLMRASQKHLNSMKSIFGGIKGYFSRGKNSEGNPSMLASGSDIEPSEPSGLQQVLEKARSECEASSAASHPALRHRGIDTSGFRDALDDEPSPYGSATVDAYRNRSQEIDKQLDRNLDEIGQGLGRLKHLATGLGNELDEQSLVVDRLTGKVEKADDTLQHQNRQIRRILKK